jgi:hypothetical protein
VGFPYTVIVDIDSNYGSMLFERKKTASKCSLSGQERILLTIIAEMPFILFCLFPFILPPDIICWRWDKRNPEGIHF